MNKLAVEIMDQPLDRCLPPLQKGPPRADRIPKLPLNHRMDRLANPSLSIEPLQPAWSTNSARALHSLALRAPPRRIGRPKKLCKGGPGLRGAVPPLHPSGPEGVLRGRENKGFWAEVLQDLISREVHRVLLFVTDGFRGLGEVIGKLFPYAEHQLCLLHMERNLRRKLSSQGFKEARNLLRRGGYATPGIGMREGPSLPSSARWSRGAAEDGPRDAGQGGVLPGLPEIS